MCENIHGGNDYVYENQSPASASGSVEARISTQRRAAESQAASRSVDPSYFYRRIK